MCQPDGTWVGLDRPTHRDKLPETKPEQTRQVQQLSLAELTLKKCTFKKLFCVFVVENLIFDHRLLYIFLSTHKDLQNELLKEILHHSVLDVVKT